MNFKMIAAAVALVAAGTANAGFDKFDTGNSSVAFFAYNKTIGTSVFIDLGVSLNDFMPAGYTSGGVAGAVPQGFLDRDGTLATWNFGANSLTTNDGVNHLAGKTNDWSAFASFIGGLGSQTTFNWAVIAGDNTNALVDSNQKYLTSGTPTNANLNAMTGGGVGGMSAMNTFMNNEKTALGNSVDNGSYYASSSSDSGYAAKNSNFNTTGTWGAKTNFQAIVSGTTTASSRTNLTVMVAEAASATTRERVGTTEAANIDPQFAAWNAGLLNGYGTLTLDTAAGTLSFQSAIPEPTSYALAIAGLVVAGAVARRRAAK